MYKCTECGCEYEQKPDFCDCGNDIFEDVKELKQADKITSEKSDIQLIESSETTPINDKTEKYRTQKSDVKYSAFSRFKDYFDPVSLSIFGFCILLSLIVIFCLWNPKETELIQTDTTHSTTNTNIPPIDKFWNNTPIQIKTVVKQEEIKKDEIQKKVTTVQIQNVSTYKKTVQKQNTNVQKNNYKAIEQAKKAAAEKAKKETEAKKAAEEAKKKAEAEKARLEQIKRDAEALLASQAEAQRAGAQRQEMASYKAGLRNTIGRRIDFTKVVGDGDCIVAFKIDPSGKLTNRSFKKQSANITLNDAVYNAVMSTPSFNPPPSGYNGEIMNLSIKYFNGNFEIILN